MAAKEGLEPYAIPPETAIGHVHLKVADLAPLTLRHENAHTAKPS